MAWYSLFSPEGAKQALWTWLTRAGTVDPNASFPKVTLDAGDIEIGAVEIKDGATDERAEVADANEASSVATKVIKVQLIANDGTKTQPVDTELPAASALDDNIAGTVSVPKIGILPYRYDRTGGLFHRAAAARGLGDGIDGADSDAAAVYLHNNGSFDRARNNTEGTLLASAARTATVSSADQTNHNARGVIVYVNVTAITATPSVVFAIEGKDPVGGSYKALLTATAITDVTGTGLYAFVVYPGATPAAGAQSSLPLPRTWRVTATHGDTDSITYSCAYALIL